MHVGSGGGVGKGNVTCCSCGIVGCRVVGATCCACDGGWCVSVLSVAGTGSARVGMVPSVRGRVVG